MSPNPHSFVQFFNKRDDCESFIRKYGTVNGHDFGAFDEEVNNLSGAECKICGQLSLIIHILPTRLDQADIFYPAGLFGSKCDGHWTAPSFERIDD
jgi:hypothetical protein